jgi:hypothetical protein
VVGGSGSMSDPNFAARDRCCLMVVETHFSVDYVTTFLASPRAKLSMLSMS